MILGRSTNLWVSTFTAVFNVAVLILATRGTVIEVPVIAGINIAFAALIAFLANQDPTVKAGDKVNVITPAGQDNKTVTVT